MRIIKPDILTSTRTNNFNFNKPLLQIWESTYVLIRNRIWNHIAYEVMTKIMHQKL